jgi:hypothetical protein
LIFFQAAFVTKWLFGAFRQGAAMPGSSPEGSREKDFLRFSSCFICRIGDNALYFIKERFKRLFRAFFQKASVTDMFCKTFYTKGTIMSNFFKLSLLAAVCCAALTVSGASWFVRGNKYNIETLVITGNYKSPRLMADLIQAESRQPYVIVPAANSRQSNCYVAMPKTNGITLTEDKLGAWVKFTGCRRVVILGDNSCVPEKYETMIDKSIPVVRISGDWERVAEELTFMLNLSNLKRSYPKLRKELDRTYQPVSAPAPKAQPKKEEKVEKVNKVEPVLASEEK